LAIYFLGQAHPVALLSWPRAHNSLWAGTGFEAYDSPDGPF
jgi:hypothetical protein